MTVFHHIFFAGKSNWLFNPNEMEVIKINEIAQQYIDYINKMEELNINVASSYIVMAAELIEIKSSILLPKKQVEVEDDYEDEFEDEDEYEAAADAFDEWLDEQEFEEMIEE